MNIINWLNKIFEAYPEFNEIKSDLILYYEKNCSENGLNKKIVYQFLKLNTSIKFSVPMSCIFELINGVLKTVDAYENQSVSSCSSLSKDILSVFTLFASCPKILEKTEFDLILQIKFIELINDIVFKYEAKKIYSDSIKTREFLRKFLIQIYGPIVVNCLSKDKIINLDEIYNNLLKYAIIKESIEQISINEIFKL